MSNNNLINEKKKALVAYKEKILEEIKDCERNIDNLRTNQKNNSIYEDVNSSDSEDDFSIAIDTGPTIAQLKQQQAMLKTCLQATQELTSLTVLQSEVTVLVDEPKFDGEEPVTEAGTWREVTAECRIDLVPFTIHFFMHTPNRKYASPSYRGLKVVPVKSAHEIELANSVLHTLKVPSDVVEVIRSYASGYRSRRTTLARLANKYASALFMAPYPAGGFVLKCAELLEVCWRLENKWSPVAPFHHKMKFDLEYIDEPYIKIITQTHKQLLDPSIPTDERTLLLAKIISTCLEARGPIDTESDLESKTTERDHETDKRDSEIEKRNSEVMAPPKSLPKKPKKSKNSLPNPAQKRSIDDDNDDTKAKRMKSNDMPKDEAKKRNPDISSNVRKGKMSDVVNVGGKKSKTDDVADKNDNLKVFNNAEVEEGDTKSKNKPNNKESGSTQSKKTNEKESGNSEEVRQVNTKSKTRNIKEPGNTKLKNAKNSINTEQDTDNANSKTKNVKQVENEDVDENAKPKDAKTSNSALNKGKAKSKNTNPKQPMNTEHVKNLNSKNGPAKETDNLTDHNSKAKNSEKKQPKNVPTTKTVNAKEAGDAEDGNTKPKNIEKKLSKGAPTTKTAKEADNADVANTKPKIIEKKQLKNILTTKNVNAKEPGKGDDDTTQAKNMEENQTRSAPATKNFIATDATNEGVKTIEKKQPKGDAITKNVTAKGAGYPENNHTNTKNNEMQNQKSTTNLKTIKNPNNNKDSESVAGENPERPKTKTTDKKTVPNTKNIENKTNNKPKTIVTTKNSEKNVANTKKAPEKTAKNKEKISEVSEKNLKATGKQTANLKHKTEDETVKKATEKHATTRNKDKISPITHKDSDINVEDKDTTETAREKPVISNLDAKKSIKVTNSITNDKKDKLPTKTMKNVHKIASHRNTLKVKNSQMTLKSGSTKMFNSGITEKENSGQKMSKIPQKKITSINESSAKKNPLRISPRKIPSKFKTISQESTFKQKIMKTSTNIPRLMKKPAPKTIH